MITLRLFACSVLGLSAFTFLVAETVPVPITIDGSLGTVAVPDLHGTLAAVQAAADEILPKEQQVDLKALIGGGFGDPELKGIPQGGGMAMVYSGTSVYGVLECSAELAETMKPVLEGQGLTAQVGEGVLIISKDPVGLNLGAEHAEAVVNTLLSPQESGIFATVRPSDLIKNFRPYIDMGIGMMPMMMMQGAQGMDPETMKSMQAMGRFSEGQMRFMVNVASQLETLGLSLKLDNEVVDMGYVLVANEGTNLHTLLSAPAVLKPDPVNTVERLSEGMMELEMFTANPEAFVDWVNAEIDTLATQMFLSGEVVSQIKNMVETWPAFMSGSMAETVQLADTSMTLEYVTGVADEAVFRETIRSLADEMEPFMELYRNMGLPMEMTFKENVRSYKGSPVDAYSFRYLMDEVDPMMAASIEMTGMDVFESELTLRDGRVLWTMGEGALDQLVDRFEASEKGTASLKARQDYPAGGWLYYDYDLAEYFSFIGQVMEAEPGFNPLQGMGEAMEGVPPMTGAAFTEENRVQFATRFPVGMIKAFVEAVITPNM